MRINWRQQQILNYSLTIPDFNWHLLLPADYNRLWVTIRNQSIFGVTLAFGEEPPTFPPPGNRLLLPYFQSNITGSNADTFTYENYGSMVGEKIFVRANVGNVVDAVACSVPNASITDPDEGFPGVKYGWRAWQLGSPIGNQPTFMLAGDERRTALRFHGTGGAEVRLLKSAGDADSGAWMRITNAAFFSLYAARIGPVVTSQMYYWIDTPFPAGISFAELYRI